VRRSAPIKAYTLIGACLFTVTFLNAAWGGSATGSRDPYASAIVIEADSNQVLHAEDADRAVYPASIVKLMTLRVVLDKISAGELSLDDEVTVTAESARMGGSQVYLAEREVFPVDDLLYALMIQSANDAAMALALHVGGTKAGFVALMNRRAVDLGMLATHFTSPHGLPPSRGQSADVTTARDVAKLARSVVRDPLALHYSSTLHREFRDGKFELRSHNELLKSYEGCDGLKTGYYSLAGFSIAATAQRNSVRVIAVVMGSRSKPTRDRNAARLLTLGFDRAPELMAAAVGPPLPPSN
jgi:D-alanyl-D-alanine carboxypeptidase (penicillin-binding protein 5/6)